MLKMRRYLIAFFLVVTMAGCVDFKMDVVQGLPGYTLISGKDTVVILRGPFNKDYADMAKRVTLDVYKARHPGHWETPEQSKINLEPIRATVVDSTLECRNDYANGCGYLQFAVKGEYVSEATHEFEFEFVINSSGENIPSIKRLFHSPAVFKVLFVQFDSDRFSANSSATDEKKAQFLGTIKNYFTRMPFAASAINDYGPSGRYWDVYPTVIKSVWNDPDSGYTPYQASDADADKVGPVLVEYNKTASIKADYAIGVYQHYASEGLDGKAIRYQYTDESSHALITVSVGVCPTAPGICTHEIGHFLGGVTEEPFDFVGSAKTCGYFDDSQDANCRDWAWDPNPSSIRRIYDYKWPYPTNRMTVAYWDEGFFTRHMYDSICIYFGGGCASYNGGYFSLRPANNYQYLYGNPNQSSNGRDIRMITKDAGLSADWRALVAREGTGYYKETFVTLHAASWNAESECIGTCMSFDLLVANPATGDIHLESSLYFFSENEYWAAKRKELCYEWKIDQLASGVVTLSCHAPNSNSYDWFLTVDDSDPKNAKLKFYQHTKHEEHYTKAL